MSVFFLFEVYRAKVLMAVQNAQHDEFFFGCLKNNYAFLICKTSKASPEFIASDARKAALCKSSDLRF
ncbi:hypothetical protein A6R70_15170 [Agrobacterium rubi]|nr:hypothetical protein [Agrobacterium rubi]OCJ54708.1 hypothetical protein A6U92_22005 [Agrobacterium rubi]